MPHLLEFTNLVICIISNEITPIILPRWGTPHKNFSPILMEKLQCPPRFVSSRTVLQTQKRKTQKSKPFIFVLPIFQTHVN